MCGQAGTTAHPHLLHSRCTPANDAYVIVNGQYVINMMVSPRKHGPAAQIATRLQTCGHESGTKSQAGCTGSCACSPWCKEGTHPCPAPGGQLARGSSGKRLRQAPGGQLARGSSGKRLRHAHAVCHITRTRDKRTLTPAWLHGPRAARATEPERVAHHHTAGA